MKFESHGRKYGVDQYGVVTQLDHKPFTYDSAYAGVYDTEGYQRESEKLQAMRLGFVVGAHGRRPVSLLDIGYGNGAFMKYAKQRIDYVYGHDVTGVFVDNCYIMPEVVKADVVTAWDVLEHFADLNFVKDIPCETICLSLPYCHFITHGKEWFDNNYPHRKPDEHIRHFNEFSLGALMDSFGWKTIAVSDHEDIVRKPKHGLQNILSMAFKRK
jgi:hypothetical protein